MSSAADAAAQAPTAGSTGRRPSTGPSWVRVFVVGLVMWVATVVVTFATANSNLIPTLILLGSFLVPITFVTYAFGRADDVVTTQRIFGAFCLELAKQPSFAELDQAVRRAAGR